MLAALSQPKLYIGTAGWSIPARAAAAFGGSGSHLERYASRLSAVEINSSFYRPHQRKTYERWAATVPAEFRFSVKVPKQITHELALRAAAGPLAQFLESASGLGEKLGCLLIQLPPSQPLDTRIAKAFFGQLRKQYTGSAVCEPRHATWFSAKADDLLRSFDVGRVIADPAPVRRDDHRSEDVPPTYHRLHGSPEVYYSPYSADYVEGLAGKIVESLKQSRDTWCIFDNTALGWAAVNALQLRRIVEQPAVVATPTGYFPQ
jgi:uncharacterized protein YecE (DUF72 family)